MLIIIGTTLLGLGSSANPQSFALARAYAESSHREAVMSSHMRLKSHWLGLWGRHFPFSLR